MKRNLFLATLILIVSITTSHAQSWQWGRNGGGSTSAGSGDNTIIDMESDKEGNMYILGVVTRTSARFMGDTVIVNGPDDLLLYKLDCNGNNIWKKQIGDISRGDGLSQRMVLDKEGNVYIVGLSVPDFSHSFVVDTDTTFTPSAGQLYESNIIKFDKNGNYKYYKTNQIPNAIGNLFGYLLPIISDDNYLYVLTNVKGNINIITRTDTTQQQYYILKYDTNAVLQSYFPITDSGVIFNWSITSDKKNIYIGGYTDNIGSSSKITIKNGHQVSHLKSFLCKFDTSGVFKWITMNEDSVTGLVEYKYNQNLSIINAVGYGGRTNTADSSGTKYGSVRAINPKTNAAGPGNRSVCPVCLVFDTSGNCLRGIALGSRNISDGYSIDHNNKNNILVGGLSAGPMFDYLIDSNATNGQDGFFVELTSDLEVIQGQVLNGNGFYDAVKKVAYDERGNIYVGGYMAGDLYLPGDTLRKIPGGNSNLFIAKYGVASCLCPYAVSNFNDVYASSLTYTYTSSSVNADTIWWDFGDGNTQSGGTTTTHTYTTAGNYTVCQHVENVCSIDEYCKNINVVTSIDDVKETYSVIIYPNPTSTSLHIHLQGGDMPEQSEYVLFDVSGKQVWSGKIIGKDTSIMISNTIIDGIYFLKINDVEGKMLVSKRVEVVR